VGLRRGRNRLVGNPPRLDRLNRRRAVPDGFALEPAPREGFDVDDDGRIDLGIGRELPRLDAAGDRQPDVGVREVVGRQRLVDPRLEVGGGEAVLEREEFTGSLEALDVGVPREDRPAVGPQRLEGGVAVPKAPVVDADGRLAGGDEVAVDVVGAVVTHP